MREKQQELLENSFPAALSPDCTEYVSYEPGSGARQQEQPDDLLLYRIVNVDGVNGPEWYGLYGSAESSGWCGLLLCASRVRRRNAAGRTDASGDGRV